MKVRRLFLFALYPFSSPEIRTIFAENIRQPRGRRVGRGAATDSGPPGQHIHSGPPAFRLGGGSPLVEIAIAFPSPSFFPLLPNQIILFQLLKLFSFVCVMASKNCYFYSFTFFSLCKLLCG